MSKGSNRRPAAVPQTQLEENWRRTFAEEVRALQPGKVLPRRCEAVKYSSCQRCKLFQGHGGAHIAGSGFGEVRWGGQ